MIRARRLALVVGFVLLVMIVWRTLPVGGMLSAFRDWMMDAGLVGMVAFAALYTLLTLVSGPAALLSASAGLVWGLAGIPVVVLSAIFASLAALGVGRHLARERVRALVARDRRCAALVRAVSEGGWRIVALIRLSPILPFGLQNYLLSMTDIRALPYTLATAVAILPSSSLYVYLGSLGRLAGQPGAAPGPVRWVLLIVGILATVLVIREVTRRARIALAAASAEA